MDKYYGMRHYEYTPPPFPLPVSLPQWPCNLYVRNCLCVHNPRLSACQYLFSSNTLWSYPVVIYSWRCSAQVLPLPMFPVQCSTRLVTGLPLSVLPKGLDLPPNRAPATRTTRRGAVPGDGRPILRRTGCCWWCSWCGGVRDFSVHGLQTCAHSAVAEVG